MEDSFFWAVQRVVHHVPGVNSWKYMSCQDWLGFTEHLFSQLWDKYQFDDWFYGDIRVDGWGFAWAHWNHAAEAVMPVAAPTDIGQGRVFDPWTPMINSFRPESGGATVLPMADWIDRYRSMSSKALYHGGTWRFDPAGRFSSVQGGYPLLGPNPL